MEMIFEVAEWKVRESKRGFHGNALPGAGHPKVVSRHV